MESKRNVLFWIGLTIELFGLFLMFGSFTWFIGLPFFIVGAVMIFFSKKKVWTKILVTVPFLISWPIAYNLIGDFMNNTTPETILIPEDLNGNFAIVYGKSCGIEPSFEKNRRVMRIPENGVLIVKSPFEAGVIDHEYYFVDAAGKRTRIEMITDVGAVKNNNPGVCLMGTSAIAGALSGGGFSTDAPGTCFYNDFLVIRKKDFIDPIKIYDDHSFDHFVDSIVAACK